MAFPTRQIDQSVAAYHLTYQRLSGGRSDVKEWRKILRKYSTDDARQVLRYLERHYKTYPKMTFQTFEQVYERLDSDPVAAEFNHTSYDQALTDELATYYGMYVPVEYVADASLKYLVFLGRTRSLEPDLFAYLDDVKEYVIKWYRRKRGAPERYFLFEVDDCRFREDINTIIRVHLGWTPQKTQQFWSKFDRAN